ncbi:olfactory receptor 1G1-like [Ambystoma mexicanum]|uniref:olfactory receptor 1G1-like n=1 Tax=Ambystoma mexicanum TaxID=8296 RepID=UPI0037E89C2D
MERNNGSLDSDFILLGFSDHPRYRTLLFGIFLSVYLLTLMGNALIIGVTMVARSLHTPMYFFLSNLSLVDACLSSVAVPRLLMDLVSETQKISFVACIAQVYFFISFAGIECFLLAAMGFDRYVAICDPLHYQAVMHKWFCVQLVAASWLINLVNSVLHTLLTSRLSFCGSRKINHFFCDLTPLFKLCCTSTLPNQVVIFTEGSLVVAAPFVAVLISYVLIVSTILKISTSKDRRRVFSTCSSHLLAVTLFYGTMIFVYFRPSSAYTPDHDRVVSVMYTIVTPLLNPFIYSLRNGEVKGAVRKLWSGKRGFK